MFGVLTDPLLAQAFGDNQEWNPSVRVAEDGQLARITCPTIESAVVVYDRLESWVRKDVPALLPVASTNLMPSTKATPL